MFRQQKSLKFQVIIYVFGDTSGKNQRHFGEKPETLRGKTRDTSGKKKSPICPCFVAVG
jgi:hypothetical protein